MISNNFQQINLFHALILFYQNHIFKQLIRSRLLYGYQAWHSTPSEIFKLSIYNHYYQYYILLSVKLLSIQTLITKTAKPSAFLCLLVSLVSRIKHYVLFYHNERSFFCIYCYMLVSGCFCLVKFQAISLKFLIIVCVCMIKMYLRQKGF